MECSINSKDTKIKKSHAGNKTPHFPEQIKFKCVKDIFQLKWIKNIRQLIGLKTDDYKNVLKLW